MKKLPVKKPKKSGITKVSEPSLNKQLEVSAQFACPIYLIERPDFLEAVNIVSEENLEVRRKEVNLNEIYPVYMTDSYYNDPRINEFVQFVGATAWNILNEQGYDMHDKVVTFNEMWTQEHFKHSSMDQHVHGFGSQIVGFYFLEVPENSSHVVFHDPRAGKVQIDLPEKDINMVTSASKMINFTPKPGLFVFANSWLAHSFTKHAAEQPIKFVHFNLAVQMASLAPSENLNNTPAPAAEVI